MSSNADHEERGNPADAQQHPPIVIPNGSLIVLCGPAGSGKSTFAHQFVEKHQDQDIKATAIVSSDRCRVLVCDDEAMRTIDADQQMKGIMLAGFSPKANRTDHESVGREM